MADSPREEPASSDASDHDSYLDEVARYFKLDLVPELRCKVQAAAGPVRASFNWLHKPALGGRPGYSRPEVVLKPTHVPWASWIERVTVNPAHQSASLQTGVIRIGKSLSCQLTGGYNARLRKPFFGYELRLLGDLRGKRASHVDLKLRHSPPASKGHVHFKTSIKADWDTPTLSGGMDEEGHVENEQDWGSISLAIPRVDMKVLLTPGLVKGGKAEEAT